MIFRKMKLNKHRSSPIINYMNESGYRRKLWWMICCFPLAAGIWVTGCSSRTGKNKNVFHYNEATGIATLDPAFAKNQSIIWAVHQLYNTLVETDDELHIVPSLAWRWEVSADRKVYTFHLRPGVLFHDNDAFPNGKGRAF